MVKKTFSFSGEGWWQGFMRRHSELSLRCTETLSYCRSRAVCKESLECCFRLLKQTLEEGQKCMYI